MIFNTAFIDNINQYRPREKALIHGGFFLLVFTGFLYATQYAILPLQDFHNHVAEVYIMSHYGSSAFFQSCFTLKYGVYPYMLVQLMLRFLMFLGSPDFAASTFVGITVTVMPLGYWFMIRSVLPEKPYLAYVVLPFMWNTMLFKGNLNFLWSLGFLFAAVGLLWKVCFGQSRKRDLAGLVLLSVLVFLSHLFGFLIFLMIAGVMLLYWLLTREKKGVPLLLFVFAPVFLVWAVSLYTRPGILSSPKWHIDWYSVSYFQQKLLGINRVVNGFSVEESQFLNMVYLLLLALVAVNLKGVGKAPMAFLLCGVLFAAYLFSPWEIYSLVRPHERILFLLILFLPLCAAGVRWIGPEKIIVLLVCVSAYFRMLDFNTNVVGKIEPTLTEARELLRTLPPQKRLLPLFGDNLWVGKICVGCTMPAYYVVDRDGYVPSLYVEDYTAIKYREPPVFYHPLSRTQWTAEVLNLYDYVFVWGDNPDIKQFVNNSGFEDFKHSGQFSLYIKRATH